MPDDFEYDMFLSDAHTDQANVRWLAQKLREAGLRLRLSRWVIRPGNDIYLAVEQGLEQIARSCLTCARTLQHPLRERQKRRKDQLCPEFIWTPVA